MQDVLALLQASIHSIQQDGAAIVENMRASHAMEADIVAAIEARIEREEYRRFCADCKRDLDPLEAEFGGLPSFDEWKQYRTEITPITNKGVRP